METSTSPLFLMATDEPSLPMDGQVEYSFEFGGCIYTEDYVSKIKETLLKQACEVFAHVQDDAHSSVALRLLSWDVDCRFDGIPRAFVMRAQRKDQLGEFHEMRFVFHRSLLEYPRVIMDSRASTRGLELTAHEVATRMHTIISDANWQSGVLRKIELVHTELDRHEALRTRLLAKIEHDDDADSDITTLEPEHYELPESPLKKRRTASAPPSQTNESKHEEEEFPAPPRMTVKLSDAVARINKSAPAAAPIVQHHLSKRMQRA